MRIDLQRHGYVHGHQLLATSIVLDKRDQEIINRLSDVSGPIGPGEVFRPYLTSYPLPSGSVVFARTWADSEARRAGCVRTQSLILAGDDWAEMASPAGLLSLLAEMPAITSAKLETVSVDLEHVNLPPVSGSLTTSLVEALFLEQRKPIVCFQEVEAETMALRLVEALWPAFRRQFAFCTYALQARTIESRPFDLLFAPKLARSRFSDWPGRKLDRAGGPASARHAWSIDLAAAIFASPKPDLRIADQLGVLRSDRDGNATALRFAMLWRDLQAKSHADPSAALGMLDVLTAADLPPEQKALQATKLFAFAADRMQHGLAPMEGMQLLRLLLTKLPPQAHQSSTIEQTEAVSEKLVAQAPNTSALVFELMQSNLFEARGLARGVGNGLAKSAHTQHVLDALSAAPPDALRAMIVESPPFLKLVMDEEVSQTNWWGQVALALAAASPWEIAGIRMKVLSEIAVAEHAKLVSIMFRTATPEDITGALDIALSASGARLPEIQRALGDTLLPRERRLVQSAVLAQSARGRPFDLLLLETLEPKGGDLDWLITEPSLDTSRRLNLLKAYLGTTSDEDVRQFVRRNPVGARTALEILAGDRQADGLGATVRLLICGPALVVGFESKFLEITRALPQRATQDLVTAALPLLLQKASVENWRSVREVVASDAGSAAIATMKAGMLIEALAGEMPPKRQAMIMQMIATLPRSHSLPSKLVRHIAALTNRLASKPVSDLGDGTIGVWADLLDQAARQRVSEAPTAAANALGYGLKNPVASVSPLVRVAFPIVLWAADQPKSPFDYWGRLLGYEVDNAREIRERIVASYVSAGWPASDLLNGAWYVDAAPKVARMLRRSRRGTDFLVSGLSALKRDKSSPKRLLDAIKDELPGRR